MKAMDDKTSASINISKAFLLSEVVMVHSILQNQLSAEGSEATLALFRCIDSALSICVPGFFILSGYLFFVNMDNFDFGVYGKKMRSRFYSLLLPYLLWCTIYGIVRYFKAKYLGFEGDGIVVDGRFSMVGFIKGYWDTGGGYPMGFVMWFIRNLIVFQLLAPIVYVIGRYWLLTAAVIVTAMASVDLYSLEYFIFGAALGIHRIRIAGLIKRNVVIVSVAFLIAASIAGQYIGTLMIPVRCVGLLMLMSFSGMMYEKSPRLSHIVTHNAATMFFIYAVHGLYCKTIDKICLSLTGYGNVFSAVACFLMSFTVIVIIAYIIYRLMKKFAPRILDILCGMRTASVKRV